MSSIFRICNQSNQGPIQCFVSKFVAGKGDDNWFTLPVNYLNPRQSDWHRAGGWESVVFKDSNGRRHGFYLYNPSGYMLELKFWGIERDLGLRYINTATGCEATAAEVELKP